MSERVKNVIFDIALYLYTHDTQRHTTLQSMCLSTHNKHPPKHSQCCPRGLMMSRTTVLFLILGIASNSILGDVYQCVEMD